MLKRFFFQSWEDQSYGSSTLYDEFHDGDNFDIWDSFGSFSKSFCRVGHLSSILYDELYSGGNLSEFSAVLVALHFILVSRSLGGLEFQYK